MTAVMSPSQSPSPSPQHPHFSPNSAAASSSLPPPPTTGHPTKRGPLQRPPSYAKNRMSAYSTTSRHSEPRSRPLSHAFPFFPSSSPYTLVRDFAYTVNNPMHYGPPPEPPETASGNTTPASERPRRLSDPPNISWDGSNTQWAAGPWGDVGLLSNQQLPQRAYGDGPPYSEDEDLHSPVVASRHKKHKSALAGSGPRQARGRSRNPDEDGIDEEGYSNLAPNMGAQRGYFTGMNGDGSETYDIGEEDEVANGAGGDLVTYPPDQIHQSILAPKAFGDVQDESDDETGSGFLGHDDSRYSRDYQFTIASPDEEMHGKAVALFDFARENENELPLVEGQIIWVSYRHGQGWLVAEDPKTGDAGLVPEEYVRLLRDIEGGWSSLSGEESPTAVRAPVDEGMGGTSPPSAASHDTVSTPTQPSSSQAQALQSSNGTNNGKSEKRPPIVSTFSTSSKDLNPYPHHLLGTQTGAVPPAVIHQSSTSQNDTPTVLSPRTSAQASSGKAGIAEESEDETTTEDEGSSKR